MELIINYCDAIIKAKHKKETTKELLIQEIENSLNYFLLRYKKKEEQSHYFEYAHINNLKEFKDKAKKGFYLGPHVLLSDVVLKKFSESYNEKGVEGLSCFSFFEKIKSNFLYGLLFQLTPYKPSFITKGKGLSTHFVFRHGYIPNIPKENMCDFVSIFIEIFNQHRHKIQGSKYKPTNSNYSTKFSDVEHNIYLMDLIYKTRVKMELYDITIYPDKITSFLGVDSESQVIEHHIPTDFSDLNFIKSQELFINDLTKSFMRTIRYTQNYKKKSKLYILDKYINVIKKGHESKIIQNLSNLELKSYTENMVNHIYYVYRKWITKEDFDLLNALIKEYIRKYGILSIVDREKIAHQFSRNGLKGVITIEPFKNNKLKLFEIEKKCSYFKILLKILYKFNSNIHAGKSNISNV